MIEVVVPIFNAADELEACLASVWHHTPRETPVILIDDASTDPAVAQLLSEWGVRAPHSWTLTSNPDNLGFVETANRGMRLASGDVVLLNSDTVVTPGWLDGLNRCLQSDPAIATATPWTNNGEIASFPRFCQPSPIPSDLDSLARVLAEEGPVTYPEIPTAVGFCMAVARSAINEIGVFDAAQFGRGYGEENDFCMRASKAGFRNVLCDDVFVAHRGGCSFGPLGLKPGDDTMRRLLERHPEYLGIVQEFIRSDPLAPRRESLVRACQRNSLSLG